MGISKHNKSIWQEEDNNIMFKKSRPMKSINLNGKTMNLTSQDGGLFDEILGNSRGYKSNRGSSIQQELDKYTRKLAETQIRS